MDLINPLEHPADWDRALSCCPQATIFHTSAWARVLAETYGHRPCYLQFPQPAGTPVLVPLMEVRSPFTGKRAVSLPFSDSGEILHPHQNCDPSLRTALESLARNRRWKYLEIRGPLPWQEASPPNSNPPPPTFVSHSLALTPDFDSLQKAFSSGHRRALKKPEGQELEVRICGDLKSLTHFYRLHSITRRRHGLPPQPWRFFESIHRHLLANGSHGFLVLAYWKKQPAAASVFFRFGTQALYKFGASDPQAWQTRPNHHVMRHAIQEFCQTGAHSLDFGRTTPGQEGLIQFKTGWGAVEAPLPYFQFRPSSGTWSTLSSASSTPGVANRLFSHLPLLANRIAGGILYPHLD